MLPIQKVKCGQALVRVVTDQMAAEMCQSKTAELHGGNVMVQATLNW